MAYLVERLARDVGLREVRAQRGRRPRGRMMWTPSMEAARPGQIGSESTSQPPEDAAEACHGEENVVDLISAAADHVVEPHARRIAGP